MTSSTLKDYYRKLLYTANKYFTASVFVVFLVFSLFFAKELSEGVRDGISIAINNVIPSSFVFSVICDYYVSMRNRSIPLLSHLISKMTELPEPVCDIMLIGSLCGFPTGALMLRREVDTGSLANEDAQSLAPFVSNPSVAFTVGAVGVGIYRSLISGLIFYFSAVLSSFISFMLFRKRICSEKKIKNTLSSGCNLSDSIKKAGETSLYIGAFIVFFSAIGELISTVLPFSLFTNLITAMLEIGKGVHTLSAYPHFIAYPLTAFILSFCGVSAYMQVKAFLPGTSIIRYFALKLFSGTLSAILTMLIMLFFH